MRHAEVQLSKEFDTPAVLAKLDVLMLFASVLRPLVLDLSNATYQEGEPRWHEVVDVLAERIAAQTGKLTEPGQAALIWNQFRNDIGISSLGPRSAAVITKMDSQLGSRGYAPDPTLSRKYLADANERAAQRVAQMETGRLCRPEAETVPVRVVVEFDPKNEKYHAQSVRGTPEIRWSLQLAEYSLWAALVVDRVFEHEYFCHLLPINTHLAGEIREGFLQGALQYEHTLKACGGTQEAQLQGRWNYAFEKFWDNLRRHFEGDLDETHWKLRNLAGNLPATGPYYWEIVGYVLDMEDGADEAQRVRSELFRVANIET